MLDTIRKLIDDMSKEYGEDFIWWDSSAFGFSPESIARFVNELKSELGPDDPFAADEIIMAAKCDANDDVLFYSCLLYTSPSPRDLRLSRMPSSA